MRRYENLSYGVIERVMKVIAAAAFIVSGFAVNRCCMWYLGQDELPENAKKLRRF